MLTGRRSQRATGDHGPEKEKSHPPFPPTTPRLSRNLLFRPRGVRVEAGAGICANRSPRPAVFSHLRPGTAADADHPPQRSAHPGQISEPLFYVISQLSPSPWLSISPLSRLIHRLSDPPLPISTIPAMIQSSTECLLTSGETYPPPPLRL
jgi:hypothetical protein